MFLIEVIGGQVGHHRIIRLTGLVISPVSTCCHVCVFSAVNKIEVVPCNILRGKCDDVVVDRILSCCGMLI